MEIVCGVPTDADFYGGEWLPTSGLNCSLNMVLLEIYVCFGELLRGFEGFGFRLRPVRERDFGGKDST